MTQEVMRYAYGSLKLWLARPSARRQTQHIKLVTETVIKLDIGSLNKHII